MLRLIRWAATSLVVLLSAGWGVVWMAQADPASQAAMVVRTASSWLHPAPPAMARGASGPFTLARPDGRAVSDLDFRGKWMLIYFGYTFCPDVCPATLQTMSSVLDQLGDRADSVAAIFITIDPQRDTPGVLGRYVALFDERLIGLTGTKRQIADVEAEYRVFSRSAPPKPDGAYLIDHTSYVYLMGPDGKLKSMFPDGMVEADMVTAVTAAMSGGT